MLVKLTFFSSAKLKERQPPELLTVIVGNIATTLIIEPNTKRLIKSKGITMLKLHNLTRIYQTEDVEPSALNKVNIEIAQGEFVAIMGPSGCGKSTLLNIIGMLDSPSSGDYIFDGENVAGYSEKQLSGIRKKSIGFIFQNFNLIDELTVFENIELPLLYNKVPTAERKQRVNEIIEKMGISHRNSHTQYTAN